MAWDIVSAHIAGWTSVELADADDQTRVTVTIHVESVGFLASMMFSSIAGAIERGLSATVDEFSAALAR